MTDLHSGADMVRLRRIRAANPSALTHSGTNSYILGSSRVAVVDPGPQDEGHLAALLGALEHGERITHIVVTHAHRDHSELAPRLAQETGAPIFAFGTATEGRSPAMQRLAASGMIQAGGDGLDLGFRPDIRLSDGETIAGGDWSLSVLHTPGHLGTHICLAMGSTLLSGDHVMGWSTSVISPPDGDMGAYMDSLERLSRMRWSRILPGHGEPVENPNLRLLELITHRRQREGQILEALANGGQNPAGLVARLYPDLPVTLIPAARRNVLAHLIDLTQKSRVTPIGDISPDSAFTLN